MEDLLYKVCKISKKRRVPFLLKLFCETADVARGFVGVQQVLFVSFRDGLLCFWKQGFCFSSVTSFQKLVDFLRQRFYVRLHTQVACGAALVFAQIFNGCVLVWHNVGGL